MRDLNRTTISQCSISVSLLFLSIFFINGCAETREKSTGISQTVAQQNMNHTITGKVTYRERMMLPPNAELHIRLEDVSRMDVAAELIAKTTLSDLGAPPYHFRLPYDESKITERRHYGLQLRIEAEGQLLFINTSRIDPFANTQTKPLMVVLSKVSSSKKSSIRVQSKPDASLLNTYWKLIELNKSSITPRAHISEIHMILDAHNTTVRGFSGCNTFRGPYTVNEKQNTLTFGNLLSTQKACFEGMGQEQKLLKDLGNIQMYSIKGNTLTLTNKENSSVMLFEAVYLR